MLEIDLLRLHLTHFYLYSLLALRYRYLARDDYALSTIEANIFDLQIVNFGLILNINR